MQLTSHPTWFVGHADPGDEPVRWYHAALWMEVDLAPWDIRRRGHVHVVAREDDLSTWRRLDIGAHPMRPVTGGDQSLQSPPADVVAALTRWLEAWSPTVHRHPGIGLVSELGEDRGDFQRRVMGAVRPEVQRRIQIGAGARSDRPPEAGEPRPDPEGLAAGVAGVATSIETRTIESVVEAVRRAEIGVLLTPQGVDLSSGRRRSAPA